MAKKKQPGGAAFSQNSISLFGKRFDRTRHTVTVSHLLGLVIVAGGAVAPAIGLGSTVNDLLGASVPVPVITSGIGPFVTGSPSNIVGGYKALLGGAALGHVITVAVMRGEGDVAFVSNGVGAATHCEVRRIATIRAFNGK